MTTKSDIINNINTNVTIILTILITAIILTAAIVIIVVIVNVIQCNKSENRGDLCSYFIINLVIMSHMYQFIRVKIRVERLRCSNN